MTNNKHFTARRLSLHFRRRTPGCWVVACGPLVSCSAWDHSCLVVGRGQAATYTAAVTGHQVDMQLVSGILVIIVKMSLIATLHKRKQKQLLYPT